MWIIFLLQAQKASPEMVQQRVADSVKGLPYTRRLKILDRRKDAVSLFGATKDPLEALFVSEQLRSLSAGPGPASLVYKIDPVAERDQNLLRASFVASGDEWPRKVQTNVLSHLGGERAPEVVRVWYAMFPILYSAEPTDMPVLDGIARSFPNSFLPPLMKARTVLDMYRRRWVGFRTYEVTAVMHKEALLAIDRAYALTTREFGPDVDWRVGWKRDLEKMRRAALTKPLLRHQ